jgi:FAD synthase
MRMTIAGTVVHGDHRGRELGFPTANLRLALGFRCPPFGIYAADARVVGEPDMAGLSAAVSVGVRPTFEDDGQVLVEVHLIGFSADLYGRKLEVELLELLREERAFDSAESLIEQMERDIEAATTTHRAAVGNDDGAILPVEIGWFDAPALVVHDAAAELALGADTLCEGEPDEDR